MKAAEPWVLGVNSCYHNGAACLYRGDKLVVAIQEERLRRQKRVRLPRNDRSLAVQYCLASAGITLRDISLVVDACIGDAPSTLLDGLDVTLGGTPADIVTITHHLGHALSAFCTSGFDESLVLVVDGAGSYGWQLAPDERAMAVNYLDHAAEHVSVYQVNRQSIHVVEKHLADTRYPDLAKTELMPRFATLGHMFSSVARQIFGQYLEAGKVMGLAPYGEVTIPPDHFVVFENGHFVFRNLVPDGFRSGERWPRRETEYANLAASVQFALETVLSDYMARLAPRATERLCYAGGVALNGVANHRCIAKAGFGDVYVPPAADDSGVAIGAACYGVSLLRERLPSRRLKTDSLGCSYTETVPRALARFEPVSVIPTADVVETCAQLLSDGAVIAWYQGGAEFGPRALGHRSILCDPRRPDAKETLNARVKHREAFRPFAPVVIAEEASKWFDLEAPSALTEMMLDVCPFRNDHLRELVPGVVHADGTGRLQTVTKEANPLLYRLLRSFQRLTSIPMLVNTSMNVMGEPIAETPRDALWLLLTTGVEYCMLDTHLVSKASGFQSVFDCVGHLTETGYRYALWVPGDRPAVSESDATRLLRRFLWELDGRRSIQSALERASVVTARHLELLGRAVRSNLCDLAWSAGNSSPTGEPDTGKVKQTRNT